MNKTSIMIVGNPLHLKNLVVPSSLKLDESYDKLSTKITNLTIALDESLTPRHQIVAVKKEAPGSDKTIAKIYKFLDRESKLKLTHCLDLTHLDLSKSLL